MVKLFCVMRWRKFDPQNILRTVLRRRKKISKIQKEQRRKRSKAKSKNKWNIGDAGRYTPCNTWKSTYQNNFLRPLNRASRMSFHWITNRYISFNGKSHQTERGSINPNIITKYMYDASIITSLPKIRKNMITHNFIWNSSH